MNPLRYKLLFALFLVHNLSHTQENTEGSSNSMEEFNQLFSYETKSISNDKLSLFLVEKIEIKLNSIADLYFNYGMGRQHYNFSPEQISQMEKRIKQIALGHYLEGNPVIIESVGGASGCPDKWIYPHSYLNTKVTKVLFCFTCTENRKYYNDLISIFNSKTKELIEKNQFLAKY